MLRQAMGDVGAEPEHVLMIGDSTFDMEMARAAGVMPIGVSWGYHPVSALKEAGAAAIVQTYEELGALLMRRGFLTGSRSAIGNPISP
jgi:phosphoglycolate phosphatase